jgi:hypothetical protein
MTERFVLDACALIAFFYKEEGGIKVKQTLERAQQNNAEVYMNKLNVLEVYYNMYRMDKIIMKSVQIVDYQAKSYGSQVFGTFLPAQFRKHFKMFSEVPADNLSFFPAWEGSGWIHHL